MPLLRIRINGSDDDLRAIADLLQSVEGIEHVEEISDLMPHMDDDDSSSAGLSDGFGGGIHELEVEAPNDYTAGRVRQAVEELAFRLGLLAEFVEDEDTEFCLRRLFVVFSRRFLLLAVQANAFGAVHRHDPSAGKAAAATVAGFLAKEAVHQAPPSAPPELVHP